MHTPVHSKPTSLICENILSQRPKKSRKIPIINSGLTFLPKATSVVSSLSGGRIIGWGGWKAYHHKEFLRFKNIWVSFLELMLRMKKIKVHSIPHCETL